MARRTTEALADAEGFFQQAIDRDPNFALAYVGLADTLMLQVGYGGAELEAVIARVKMLVAKAQSLDPGLAEAVVSSAAAGRGTERLVEGRGRVPSRHRVEPQLRHGPPMVQRTTAVSRP